MSRAVPSSNAPTGRDWLVGPWFDPLLIANVGWPAIVAFAVWSGGEAVEGVRFWQIYFVTTPHRWITLALVFLDRRRFRQRRGAFLLVLAAAVAAVAGVRLGTGEFTCLLLVDYLWNAWHFAAQHHGVWRIYQRQSSVGVDGLVWRKWLLRGFVCYVIGRVAGGAWRFPALDSALAVGDGLAVLATIGLAAGQWRRRRRRAENLYLGSVLALYVALLAAVHFQRPAWLLPLTVASALFHATEYLAIVRWSVERRTEGLLGALAARWTLVMAIYLATFGFVSWTATQASGTLATFWLFGNLVAAFLHYAYDGMIWKAPVSDAN